MDNYAVEILEVSKELTARERIAIKDTTNAVKLDEATKKGQVTINPEFYAILEVHNPKGDNPVYNNYIIVDKDGTKYVTGSTSFWSAFEGIAREMNAAGEDFSVTAYRKESKNYKGKDFITCSII